LKIPPVLLGLPLLSESDPKVIRFIEAQKMMAYDDMLSMVWSLFYAGIFNRQPGTFQTGYFCLKMG
jgi:hypothetical protein